MPERSRDWARDAWWATSASRRVVWRSAPAAIEENVQAFSRQVVWARSRMAEGPIPGMGEAFVV